jgi:hypothetical protein
VTNRGLATRDDYPLAEVVLASWDAFIKQVDGADLAARTRLDGWAVRDVVIHLGTWDGESSLGTALATLGTDAARRPVDPDVANAAMVAATPRS